VQLVDFWSAQVLDKKSSDQEAGGNCVMGCAPVIVEVNPIEEGPLRQMGAMMCASPCQTAA